MDLHFWPIYANLCQICLFIFPLKILFYLLHSNWFQEASNPEHSTNRPSTSTASLGRCNIEVRFYFLSSFLLISAVSLQFFFNCNYLEDNSQILFRSWKSNDIVDFVLIFPYFRLQQILQTLASPTPDAAAQRYKIQQSCQSLKFLKSRPCFQCPPIDIFCPCSSVFRIFIPSGG